MSRQLTVYADTSAMATLLLGQPRAPELLEWLNSSGARLVSSDLLETEMRRVGFREDLPQAEVSAILDGVTLFALDRTVFTGAGLLPMPYLRSLDALHLQAALMLSADALLTYDRRLADAAHAVGLRTLAPGED